MFKRFIDFTLASVGLVISSPILLPVMLAVYLQDGHSPFYIAPRVGKDEKIFKMFKLRSMIINADKNKVDSTSSNDNRITRVGQFIRNWKLDELTQLINVFLGDMSLVGPRPNVKRETDLYTAEEKKLLTVRPGITDFSSIVFSDEGDILKDLADPDLSYNQLIRPWKSRLGLFYIDHSAVWLDLRLIFLTVVAIVSRANALAAVQHLLESLGAEEALKQVARRASPLTPFPPPGSTQIVTSRTE